MRSWTVHLPPGAAPASVPSTGPALRHPPRLIPEGFSFWAFLFGPFWLLRHGAVLAAVAVLAALLALAFIPDPWGMAGGISLHLLLGLHGHDLRRWTLARRGWKLAHVVQARDADGALVRLIQAEPRLFALYAAELRK